MLSPVIGDHKTLPRSDFWILSCFSSSSDDPLDMEIGVQVAALVTNSADLFENGLDVGGKFFKLSVSIDLMGMFSTARERWDEPSARSIRNDGIDDISGNPFVLRGMSWLIT